MYSAYVHDTHPLQATTYSASDSSRLASKPYGAALSRAPFSRAAGKVLVDGKPVTKTGTQVKPDADVVITAEQPKYVCR